MVIFTFVLSSFLVCSIAWFDYIAYAFADFSVKKSLALGVLGGILTTALFVACIHLVHWAFSWS